MKSALILLIPLIGIITAAILPEDREVKSSGLKILWKANIGRTTHRTNVDFLGDQLVIGSNGSHFNDYMLEDNNGIFILDPKTGKHQLFFGGEQFGDMDVNGLKVIDDKVVFANDNDEILCVDRKGKTVWRVPFSGDVEHEPTLLRSGARDVLVFATENGELRAVDPSDGSTIWQHFHPDFDGWKEGDNRTYFKIRAHFTSGNIFFDRPLTVDLDRDGVIDLLYNANYSTLYAVSGKSGKLLWSEQPDDEYGKMDNGRQSPVLFATAKKIGFPRYNAESKKQYFTLMNFNGKIEKNIELSSWANASLSHASDCFNLLDRSIQMEGDRIIELTHDRPDRKKEPLFNAYTDAQVSQQTVRLKNEECFVMLYQYSNGMSCSAVAIIGKETGKIHFTERLPMVSEFTPFIKDLDKDGQLDMLIGGQDGILYAFELKIPVNDLVQQ